jgi:FAD-dependent monooxygenase
MVRTTSLRLPLQKLTTPSQTLSIPATAPVLIVGGGPAGLMSALQLARQGISCTLIERNLDTTKWPKMDVTNTRSMELLRPNRLNVGDGLRGVGVPGRYPMLVLFSTGLSDGGEVITKWVRI